MVLGVVASLNFFLLLIVGALLAAGVSYAFRRDTIRKTAVLLYDFDPIIEQAFGKLHESATRLAECCGCWHIAASGTVHDGKYHAGASELVDRKDTTIQVISPDFLATNVETVAIEVGQQVLYFFPDRLLVFDSGRVGAVSYDELNVEVTQTRFIEEKAPGDARVVDQTWRYINKKGGPDRPLREQCTATRVSLRRTALHESIWCERDHPSVPLRSWPTPRTCCPRACSIHSSGLSRGLERSGQWLKFQDGVWKLTRRRLPWQGWSKLRSPARRQKQQ